MKEIYTKANEVYVWLGVESEESDLAMQYISRKGKHDLKPRGDGYFPFSTNRERKALSALFERPYWVRSLQIMGMSHTNLN
jgi:hypothetical protein